MRLDDEADTFCVDVLPARTVGHVRNRSRGAMDIEGLGKQRVQEFASLGLLRDIGDVYSLDWERIGALKGYGREVSVERPRGAIDASPVPPPLAGSGGPQHPPPGPTGAPGVGPGLRPFDGVIAASVNDIAAVDNWGSPRHRHRCGPGSTTPPTAWSRSWTAGVDFGQVTAPTAPQVLAGVSVVVAGRFEGFSGGRAEEVITRAGRQVSGSVCAAVVVGDAPGQAKVTKAEGLGVRAGPGRLKRLLETGELP